MVRCVPSFAVILAIILITGVVGGIRNAISDQLSGAIAKSGYWLRIIEGITASAAVPLFLSVVGNEKIGAAFGPVDFYDPKYDQATFILIGFCGLASVFSQRFLDSVSKKVMQLTDKVEQVEQKIEQSSAIAELQIEPNGDAAQGKVGASPSEGALTDTQRKVLKALATGHFLMRSATGLAQNTGLEPGTVAGELGALASAGLARQLTTSKGDRWALTDAGRRVVGDS